MNKPSFHHQGTKHTKYTKPILFPLRKKVCLVSLVSL
jgi:hypothetical protein